jgi:hypothetical protein
VGRGQQPHPRLQLDLLPAQPVHLRRRDPRSRRPRHSHRVQPLFPLLHRSPAHQAAHQLVVQGLAGRSVRNPLPHSGDGVPRYDSYQADEVPRVSAHGIDPSRLVPSPLTQVVFREDEHRSQSRAATTPFCPSTRAMPGARTTRTVSARSTTSSRCSRIASRRSTSTTTVSPTSQ